MNFLGKFNITLLSYSEKLFKYTAFKIEAVEHIHILTVPVIYYMGVSNKLTMEVIQMVSVISSMNGEMERVVELLRDSIYGDDVRSNARKITDMLICIDMTKCKPRLTKMKAMYTRSEVANIHGVKTGYVTKLVTERNIDQYRCIVGRDCSVDVDVAASRIHEVLLRVTQYTSHRDIDNMMLQMVMSMKRYGGITNEF